MRVIDFGETSALRSQTVWHALARAVRVGDEPTLSFVRPRVPYVCLGLHRGVDEVDIGFCRARQLPVYRRLVGGGPVYLDPHQLFFQVSLPAGAIAARRATALAELLRPAVAALREAGAVAELDRFGEISVGRAKVCGHGAGQLGDGVVVVGNLITRFDHARATRVLALDPDMRRVVLPLMRRHVAATPVDPLRWKAAMVRAYAAHFGQRPRPDRMTADERVRLGRMDTLLGRRSFVVGEARPVRPVRTVKVRAGVWVHDWSDGAERLVIGVADGVVDSAFGTRGVVLPEELVGLPLHEARHELARDGRIAPLAAAIDAANKEVTAA